MTRGHLLFALLVVAAPRVSVAEDASPCATEAEAVRKMKKRDPSLAYPKDADAVKHLEAAKRAFGVQQYDKAIEEYTAAGLADDAPLILYNLGQTYRAAKEYEKAIRQYELFLDRGKPGEQVRALVECHIQTMTAELEQAASTAPPQGPATDQPDTLEVGTPVDNDSGEADVSPSSRWTTTRKIGLGIGAAGVLTVAAGVVFGIQGQGYKDDAARLCPASPCAVADEANAFSDKADSRALMANISYGAGAAMIVGSAVLWFVGGASSDASPDRTTFVPSASRSFTGLVVTTTF